MVSGCLVTMGLAHEFGFDSTPQRGDLVKEVVDCWYLQVGERQVDGQAVLVARCKEVR